MLKKGLFVIFTLIFHYNVSACLCIPPTLEKEWEYSSHIFTGKILSIKQYPDIYYVQENNKYQYITIEVIESFKGFYNIPKYITLIKPSSSCERNYSENKTYIFYCSTFMGIEMMYAPDTCSRTMDSKDLNYNDEITSLTKLKKINPPPVNSQSLRTMEEDELNNLRNDAALSVELRKENKTLKIIILGLSSIVLLGLFRLFYFKFKTRKKNQKYNSND